MAIVVRLVIFQTIFLKRLYSLLYKIIVSVSQLVLRYCFDSNVLKCDEIKKKLICKRKKKKNLSQSLHLGSVSGHFLTT